MPVNEAKYIKEVWAENLEEEMAYLRDLVEEYPYLAMVRIYYTHLKTETKNTFTLLF